METVYEGTLDFSLEFTQLLQNDLYSARREHKPRFQLESKPFHETRGPGSNLKKQGIGTKILQNRRTFLHIY